MCNASYGSYSKYYNLLSFLSSSTLKSYVHSYHIIIIFIVVSNNHLSCSLISSWAFQFRKFPSLNGTINLIPITLARQFLIPNNSHASLSGKRKCLLSYRFVCKWTCTTSFMNVILKPASHLSSGILITWTFIALYENRLGFLNPYLKCPTSLLLHILIYIEMWFHHLIDILLWSLQLRMSNSRTTIRIKLNKR